MKRLVIYSLGLAALLGTSILAFGQLYGDSGNTKATREQLEECSNLGIPAFECTEEKILEKRRIIENNSRAENTIKATREQLEECSNLGIPAFECTEEKILEKRRIIEND